MSVTILQPNTKPPTPIEVFEYILVPGNLNQQVSGMQGFEWLNGPRMISSREPLFSKPETKHLKNSTLTISTGVRYFWQGANLLFQFTEDNPLLNPAYLALKGKEFVNKKSVTIDAKFDEANPTTTSYAQISGNIETDSQQRLSIRFEINDDNLEAVAENYLRKRALKVSVPVTTLFGKNVRLVPNLRALCEELGKEDLKVGRIYLPDKSTIPREGVTLGTINFGINRGKIITSAYFDASLTRTVGEYAVGKKLYSDEKQEVRKIA